MAGVSSDIDRSPNTVKAYAHDLKDYWLFLDHRGLDWREVRLEDIGEYVAWLALPPAARSEQVAVLASVAPQVGRATINRKLSALSAFYTHQVRHGVDVGELLTTWQPGGGRGGWKPFLHHVSKGKPHARRAVGLTAPVKLPRVLSVAEMQAILDACEHLRDRFLFALLWDRGVRIGEALGLRHEDVAAGALALQQANPMRGWTLHRAPRPDARAERLVRDRHRRAHRPTHAAVARHPRGAQLNAGRRLWHDAQPVVHYHPVDQVRRRGGLV